jgi:hypothetical protein
MTGMVQQMVAFLRADGFVKSQTHHQGHLLDETPGLRSSHVMVDLFLFNSRYHCSHGSCTPKSKWLLSCLSPSYLVWSIVAETCRMALKRAQKSCWYECVCVKAQAVALAHSCTPNPRQPLGAWPMKRLRLVRDHGVYPLRTTATGRHIPVSRAGPGFVNLKRLGDQVVFSPP